MRTETREVTEIKTVYIADDGKEFDYEEDCENHEVWLKEQSLLCFDHKCVKCRLEDCTYVYIRTEKELKNLIEVLSYLGISRVGLGDNDGVGIYMYVGRGDNWVNISKSVDIIKEKERLWNDGS